MNARCGILSTDVSQVNMPPMWACDLSNQGAEKVKTIEPLSAIARLSGGVRSQLTSGSHVARAENDALEKSKSDSVYPSIFQAPQCVLNDRIKRIANAYSATINDVVLDICGGSLRDY